MPSGRARALLLSALLCCGALALGAARFLRDGTRSSDGAPRTRATSNPAEAEQPDPVEATAARTATKEKGEATATDGAAADDDPDAPFRGTGTVTLTVVDAVSDLPLADLPFLCWSERPAVHV